jgi:uncharacterized protein (TIGR00290 family)
MKVNKKHNPIKVSLSWSGGKDSAFTLFHLLQDERYEVVSLHTTFGEESRRVGMHGIHEDLIVLQAKALNLPLLKIYYPASGDNQAYEKAMDRFTDLLISDGIAHIAYGDIFLPDLRKYREDQLAKKSLKALFPLWEKDTSLLAEDFINQGFKTIICAADADKVAPDWVGKEFSHEFLASLPEAVDPCGENGEFHSFCYGGPIYKESLRVKIGDKIKKSYSFKYADDTAGEKWFWFVDVS